MTLSDDVRNELAAIAPERRCDRLAELSALFHTAGSAHLRGRGAISVHLDLVSSAAARRAFSLLRDLGVHSEIRTYQRHAFDRATRYQLHVEGDDQALVVLREAGVLDARLRPLEHPPLRVVGRSCCRGAYLRGAFLGAGSLSGPGSPHLELRTTSLDGAEFLRDVARRQGIDATGVADRGSHAVFYAKGGDAIEGLLLAAGADAAVLALEERAVLAATRAHANRLANADHANLVRTSRAANQQIDAVRRLAADGTFDSLPDRLQEAGRLRIRYPTLSLAELARRADPPATKAGMHRRLRRLCEFADMETAFGVSGLKKR